MNKNEKFDKLQAQSFPSWCQEKIQDFITLRLPNANEVLEQVQIGTIPIEEFIEAGNAVLEPNKLENKRKITALYEQVDKKRNDLEEIIDTRLNIDVDLLEGLRTLMNCQSFLIIVKKYLML